MFHHEFPLRCVLRNLELLHAGTRGNDYHHVVLYALNESPRIHRRHESILTLPLLREEQKKTRTDRDMMHAWMYLTFLVCYGEAICSPWQHNDRILCFLGWAVPLKGRRARTGNNAISVACKSSTSAHICTSPPLSHLISWPRALWQRGLFYPGA